MPYRSNDIAIVGGGASGVLLAIQLMRQAAGRLQVTLVERGPDIGFGLAYATGCAGHLLNTRAADMSALPDEPDHFVRWLGHEAGSGDFVSRQTYGRYLQDMLKTTVARSEGRLQLVTGNVVAATPERDGVLLTIDGAAPVFAGRVVLATGHRAPGSGRGGALRGDPWSSDALDGLAPTAPVLLIGTGLTMIDVVISLMERDHMGQIVALSRRGLLPRTHPVAPRPAVVGATDALFAGALSARLGAFRHMARAGAGWEAVMQALRPHNAALWQSLDEPQRRRFLRHLRPWWDVHRHRVPPQVGRGLKAVIAAGQLSIVAGRIVAVDTVAGPATVTISLRGSGRREVHDFGRVIDCTGPRSDPDVETPLQAQLARDGLLRADPLGLGFDVGDGDALLSRAAAASPRLLALGPPTRGRHWEITAIPDIRKRAATMAGDLIRAIAP
ncbi:MAG: FAD/NAD(P)-binding protein [Rhizobiales bacterium]|nr:FAD/NAD(P)-binding protein [Hyphomicrobiales bacterium]